MRIDIKQLLPTFIREALMGANAPSSGNPFATLADVVSSGGGIVASADTDSNTISGTTLETAIVGTGYTYTIPANTLVIGDRYRVIMWGRFSTPGPVASNIYRLKLNGTTTILATSAQTNEGGVTSFGYSVEVEIVIKSIGVGGTMRVNMKTRVPDAAVSIGGTVVANVADKAIDTTVANTFSFTMQLGNANPGNSWRAEQAVWQKLN
jgi:hypothetical protein